MASQAESDEEYFDDPIQLVDFKHKEFNQATNKHTLNGQPVFELTDSDGDLYIEKNLPQKNWSLIKKVPITLPVTFFEIPRNVELLNECKLLSIKLVNCLKHPYYYKKLLHVANNIDKEVDFYTKKSCKDDMIEEGRKIKIKPAAPLNETLKMDSLKRSVKKKRKENKLSECDVAQDLKWALNTKKCSKKINFKKNQGLIGMKITQTDSISLNDKQNNATETKLKWNKSNSKSADVRSKTEKDPKTAVIISKTPDAINHLVGNAETTNKSKSLKKLKDVNDKSVQDNTKVTGKLNTVNKHQVQKNLDKVLQSNAKVENENTFNIPKDPKENYSQNNSNSKIVLSKISEDNTAASKSDNHSNTMVQSGLSCQQQINNKEEEKPDISYQTKLSKSKLIRSKKDWAIHIPDRVNNIKTKNCPNTKSIISIDKSNRTKEDSKERSSDAGKMTIGNNRLSSMPAIVDAKKNSILNMKLFKPKKDAPQKIKSSKVIKKNDQIEQKNCSNNFKEQYRNAKEEVSENPISSDSQNKYAQPENGNHVELLNSKIVKNSGMTMNDNKCNNILQMSMYKSHPGAVHDNVDTTKNLNQIMQQRPAQNSNNNNFSQILNHHQQGNFQQTFSQFEKVSSINTAMKNNTVNKIANQITNNMLIKRLSNNPSISHTINHNNNSSVKGKLLKNINSITPANVNTFAANPVQNMNQSSPAPSQSKDITFMNNTIETRPNLLPIPLNIPPEQKRLPTIIKKCKRNPEISDNLINTNNNTAGTSLLANAIRPVIQKNINENERTINLGQQQNRMQTYPIEISASTREKLPKRNTSHKMLSHLYAVAQQMSRQSALQHQSDQHNMKPQRTGQDIRHQSLLNSQKTFQATLSNVQTSSNLQAADPKYKTSQEILPPTCDIAMLQTKPRYNVFQNSLQDSKVPNISPFQQQPFPSNPTHIVLRPTAPNHVTAGHQMQSGVKPGVWQDLNTIKPRQEASQNTDSSNYGMYVPQNNPYFGQGLNTNPSNYGMYVPQNNPYIGQGFETFSNINTSGISQHNYMYCAPNFNSFPKNTNPTNQVPYWSSFNPPPKLPTTMLPPPPPPPYSEPVQQPSTNRTSAPYSQTNNVSIPKSITGTTVIGCNNSGPVRKINLLVESLELNSMKSNDLTECQLTAPVLPVENKLQPLAENNANNMQKPSGQNNKPVHSKNDIIGDGHIVFSKKEMLEELTKITTIESSSPMKDIKRPLTKTDATFQESAKLTNIKRPKPGPLSRKPQLNAIASQSQIYIQTSPVAHKGYSAPILPIPTYEKTLELLAKSNVTENYEEIDLPDTILKKITKRRYAFDEKDDKSAKKISLDEYKKRTCKPDDEIADGNRNDLEVYTIKKEIKSEYSEQDLGYSSDCTMRV